MMSSSSTRIVPVTIRVERHLQHRPEEVFDAYADIEQRTKWLTGPEDTISYESHDFRTGGSDYFVQQRHGGRSVSGTNRYEHIVVSECIVIAERRLTTDGRLLTLSLTSWSVAPEGPGSALAITYQTTSVVGSQPIEGARYRYEMMVDRLTRHLSDRAEGRVTPPRESGTHESGT